MAVVGPVANILFGVAVGAIVLAVSPQINLFARPWITPAYLLRSSIWMNVLLGAVNLLPAAPLDGGRVFRGEFAKARGGIKGSKAAAGIGQIVAYALIIAGMAMMVAGTTAGMWLLIIGAFLLIGARMEDQGLLLQADVDAVRMRDVMLLEFSTLSASDTLEDALQRSIHELAGCFLVVGVRIWWERFLRQGIVEALADGREWVCAVGVMRRGRSRRRGRMTRCRRRQGGDCDGAWCGEGKRRWRAPPPDPVDYYSAESGAFDQIPLNQRRIMRERDAILDDER